MAKSIPMTPRNFSLTQMEQRILNELRQHRESSITDGNGVKWWSVYLDNCERLGLTTKQFTGILGSLTVKGFYQQDDGECFGLVRGTTEQDEAEAADEFASEDCAITIREMTTKLADTFAPDIIVRALTMVAHELSKNS